MRYQDFPGDGQERAIDKVPEEMLTETKKLIIAIGTRLVSFRERREPNKET